MQEYTEQQQSATPREIVQAHVHLVAIYKELMPRLRMCIGPMRGVRLQTEPEVVMQEPFAPTPAGLAAMRERVVQHGYLPVSGLNNTTMYPEDGNAWFRTVHDLTHVLFDLGFTADEEIQVHTALWRFIETSVEWFALTERSQRVVRAVYNVDTYAQSAYFTRHGEFPADQGQFLLDNIAEHM